MTLTAVFDRPLSGTLIIRLENGTEMEATEENVARFGLLTHYAFYEQIHDFLQVAIDRIDTGRVSLADAQIRPIRDLLDAVCHSKHADPEAIEKAMKAIGDMEATLQQVARQQTTRPRIEV